MLKVTLLRARRTRPSLLRSHGVSTESSRERTALEMELSDEKSDNISTSHRCHWQEVVAFRIYKYTYLSLKGLLFTIPGFAPQRQVLKLFFHAPRPPRPPPSQGRPAGRATTSQSSPLTGGASSQGRSPPPHPSPSPSPQNYATSPQSNKPHP